MIEPRYTKLTSADCVVLVKQARDAGEYFVDMAEDSGELGDYKFDPSEASQMLGSHPLYLADDRTEIELRHVPLVVRDAMKYICWKAAREALAKLKTGGHVPEGYPRGGKARKGKRPRGAGLIGAARALKDAWR